MSSELFDSLATVDLPKIIFFASVNFRKLHKDVAVGEGIVIPYTASD